MDTCGLHAFVCKMAPSQITRHHSLNDIISRAFASAKIPVTKEPSSLFRSDDKRPDGLTQIPWHKGLSLTWEVTVATSLTDSYISASTSSAGAAAEMAASRKQETQLMLTNHMTRLEVSQGHQTWYHSIC